MPSLTTPQEKQQVLVWVLSRSHWEIRACSRGTVRGHLDGLSGLWLYFLSVRQDSGHRNTFHESWASSFQAAGLHEPWNLEYEAVVLTWTVETGDSREWAGEPPGAPSLQSSPQTSLLFILASSSSGHSWPKQRSHTSLSVEPSVIRVCLPKAVFDGINLKLLTLEVGKTGQLHVKQTPLQHHTQR